MTISPSSIGRGDRPSDGSNNDNEADKQYRLFVDDLDHVYSFRLRGTTREEGMAHVELGGHCRSGQCCSKYYTASFGPEGRSRDGINDGCSSIVR